jgi:microcystin-dependent protein
MPQITKILFRRGLNSDRKAVTFNLGEPAFCTDTKRLFVGDGSTLGGVPAGTKNYGANAALSGSYYYNGFNTNLNATTFSIVSAALRGDIIYDGLTSAIYGLSSNSYVPALSDFEAYLSPTGVNGNQFYYSGGKLNIQNGVNGIYGVGINELNASVVGATLSGGNGAPLNIRLGSVGNNYVTPGSNNSVKITLNGAVNDTAAFGQYQLLGRTGYSGSTLGPVTLSATGSLTLSSNISTILLYIPTFLPLSGGSITGGISALNANNGRLVTDVTPANPYDVVNLSYVNLLSAVTPSYISTRYLPLSGGTLINSGGLSIPGILSVNSNTNITGTLSANNLTVRGSISAVQGLSAAYITSLAVPVVGTDVTNKAFTDSKYLPVSGGTLTGRLFTPNTPSTSTEIATKGYVDSLQSLVSTNFLPLSGGTLTGAVSSTDRIYVTNTPIVSAELANKNYVDSQIVAGTVPPGTVSFFAGTTPPTGWIKANGAVLPIAGAYNNLYNALAKRTDNTNTIWWVPGDGSNNFRLPDLRGQFIRGWNDNILQTKQSNTTNVLTIPTTDPTSYQFGVIQQDQFQGHYHSATTTATIGNNINVTTFNNYGLNNGQLAVNGVNVYAGTLGTVGVGNPTVGGTNGTPRTGSETRPTNIALLACIKY